MPRPHTGQLQQSSCDEEMQGVDSKLVDRRRKTLLNRSKMTPVARRIVHCLPTAGAPFLGVLRMAQRRPADKLARNQRQLRRIINYKKIRTHFKSGNLIQIVHDFAACNSHMICDQRRRYVFRKNSKSTGKVLYVYYST